MFVKAKNCQKNVIKLMLPMLNIKFSRKIMYVDKMLCNVEKQIIFGYINAVKVDQSVTMTINTHIKNY